MAKKKKTRNNAKNRKKERKMTDKQKRFVEEYCVDFNATQAAIRAGYSEKWARKTANNLWTKVDIRKAIDKRIEKRKKKLEITEKEIIAELAKIGFSDVSNYYEQNFEPKDITTLPNELTAAIKEVIKINTEKGSRIGLKFHSKEAALELLGKHLGMWKADQNDKETLIIIRDETEQYQK